MYAAILTLLYAYPGNDVNSAPLPTNVVANTLPVELMYPPTAKLP